MAWSTREVAELAGTSLRAVRHYHDVGLLPEPQRRSNGYKQYGVAHLTRLLRITRLVGLGFSLGQIAELGDRDEHPEEELRALDADLLAEIERLQRLRAELADTLERGVPTDLPPEFAVRTPSLSEADRSMVAVMGRLLEDDDERAVYAEILSDQEPFESAEQFDTLAPDADEATRAALAERMRVDLHDLLERHPGLPTLGAAARRGPQRYRRTIEQAMGELYNPAQLDVMARLRQRRT